MLESRRSKISVALIGIITSCVSQAGSFSLYTESNGYSIGNFAAGVAAEAYDASTGWYNPAGLALIHDQQAIIAGVWVLPSTSLNGTSQFITLEPPAPPYLQTFSDLNGAENGVVPSFYYAKPLGDNATFGLSINAPFGLSTNWGLNSPVRYDATLSELQTINISPELGGKIFKNFAFGAGLDLQYAKVKFNSILGSPAVLNSLDLSPSQWDSSSNNSGNSWNGGFHTGIMMMFDQNHTRIGLNYQSGIKHQFRGISRLNGPLANPNGPFDSSSDYEFTSNSLMSNNLYLPNIVTLSGYRDVNERVALLGSVVFTGWSNLRTIEMDNVAGFDPVAVKPALVDFVSLEDYRDAWRFALGANYQLNDRWKLRFGGGYDQTPTINAQRDVRAPDIDRWAISIGAHYQPYQHIVIDAGYTYLQGIGQVAVDKTTALGDINYDLVNAHGHTYANIFGAQITWLIDKPRTRTIKA